MYTRQIATAQRLLKKYGAAATWRRPNATVPDSATPWIVTDTSSTDYPVFVVLLPTGASKKGFASRGKNVQSANADAPEAQLSRQLAYMVQAPESPAFTPEKTDLLVIGTDVYRLSGIDPLAPNGTAIIYTLEIVK